MLRRGCGGLSLESPRVYSATDTGDLQVAVDGLRTMYPDAPILLAGFSLGALLVTKYLAEAASSTAASGRVWSSSLSRALSHGNIWDATGRLEVTTCFKSLLGYCASTWEWLMHSCMYWDKVLAALPS